MVLKNIFKSLNVCNAPQVLTRALQQVENAGGLHNNELQIA